VNVAGGPAQCPAPGCGSTPPPTCPDGQVMQDGVCVPKPPPQPGEVPAIGVAVGDGTGLLRIHQNQYVKLNDPAGTRFNVFGCVACCDAWGKVQNQLWPGVSPGFIDACGAYGGNLYHWRMGPWGVWCADGDTCGETDWWGIGGPYLNGTEAPSRGDGSLQWNPKFWETFRQSLFYAGGWGAAPYGHPKRYVEVVVNDTWYIKHCEWKDGVECVWPQSEIHAAFVGERSPQQERLIRKVVAESCDMDNVIYATGNEEDEVPAGGSLYQWYVTIVRDEETKCATKKVHLIGTGSSKSGIAADYSITHANAPVTGPCNGRLCMNNEHNPEKEVAEEAFRFQKALDAGQAYHAWRAGAKDAKWEERLSVFRDIFNGGGSNACFAPPSEPADDWEWHDRTYRSAETKITEAVENAKRTVGNPCGQMGPSDTWIDPEAAFGKQFETIAAVAEQVRAQGFCASGPWGDALAVTRKDGLIEERHIVAFGTGCFTSDPEVNPKSYWRWLKGMPPQPPAEGACTNPDPIPIAKFNVKEHTKGPNKTVVDSTPIVRSASYCASIGFTDGRGECPVRMEGDPARPTCEAQVVGVPQWTGPGAVSAENAYQYWVPRGVLGTATVCTSTAPKVCGSVEMTP